MVLLILPKNLFRILISYNWSEMFRIAQNLHGIRLHQFVIFYILKCYTSRMCFAEHATLFFSKWVSFNYLNSLKLLSGNLMLGFELGTLSWDAVLLALHCISRSNQASSFVIAPISLNSGKTSFRSERWKNFTTTSNYFDSVCDNIFLVEKGRKVASFHNFNVSG